MLVSPSVPDSITDRHICGPGSELFLSGPAGFSFVLTSEESFVMKAQLAATMHEGK